jgi:hypothetical protein
MKTYRFQNTVFNISKIPIYLGALGILYFTGIMLLKIIPYMDFGFSTNFLGTKTDAVLYKTHFRIAFYLHITSSLVVMGIGIFQFFPLILSKFPRFHRFYFWQLLRVWFCLFMPMAVWRQKWVLQFSVLCGGLPPILLLWK